MTGKIPEKLLFTFAQALSDSFSYRFISEARDPSIDFLEIFLTRTGFSLPSGLEIPWIINRIPLALELNYTVKDYNRSFM